MINISGFGLSAQIVGDSTFPTGFLLTEFADDADPLDSPDLETAEAAMGGNGDMVVWSKPMGIEMSFNVIPSSQGDINLSVLLNANRIAKGKNSAKDKIGIVVTYPDGSTVNMSSGVIISGPIVPPVSSSGRLKSHMYKFKFEQVTKTAATN